MYISDYARWNSPIISKDYPTISASSSPNAKKNYTSSSMRNSRSLKINSSMISEPSTQRRECTVVRNAKKSKSLSPMKSKYSMIRSRNWKEISASQHSSDTTKPISAVWKTKWTKLLTTYRRIEELVGSISHSTTSSFKETIRISAIS
jgi:hypothetical protein